MDDQPIHRGDQRGRLESEAARLSQQISLWRRETGLYRAWNVALFLVCKIFIPAGALVVAVNLVLLITGDAPLSNLTSSILAVLVTVLASLEAILNPGGKKRVAFTLNNDLRALQNRLDIDQITLSDDEFRNMLIEVNDELRLLLNRYSDNGY